MRELKLLIIFTADAAKDSCHQGSIRKPDQLSSAHNEAGGMFPLKQ